MKKMLATLIALVTVSSTVFAASTAAASDSNYLVILFLGFFALIVVFQLVPATILLIGMIKGLFSSNEQVEVKH